MITREELEEELKHAYDAGYNDKGVNDYDFHSHTYKALDNFKAKTCANCKHSTLITRGSDKIMYNTVSICKLTYNIEHSWRTYGCTNYESNI